MGSFRDDPGDLVVVTVGSLATNVSASGNNYDYVECTRWDGARPIKLFEEAQWVLDALEVQPGDTVTLVCAGYRNGWPTWLPAYVGERRVVGRRV